MSSLFDEMLRDEKEYLNLCEIYNESPKFKKNKYGELIYDIYGAHSLKLKNKYKMDNN